MFAGVGGFDLGFEAAGWQCRWQAEWDEQCQRILRKHWPDIPKHYDVRDVDGKLLEPVDAINFGSPCQDLSVAGKRAGLGGSRSNLFHEAMRIIREMRDATNGAFPRLAIWENVPGALNSNKGADFGVVLDEMAESGAVAVEWAVLDAQHFGIPQRRRRVFVCALFDTGAAEGCSFPILSVREGLRRNSKKGKKKEQDFATPSSGGVAGGGGPGSPLLTDVNQLGFDSVSGDSSFLSDPSSPSPYTATSFAKYVDGVGTLRAAGGDLGGGSETLLAYEKEEAMVFHPHRQDGVRMQGETVNTLTAFMGTGGLNTPMVAQPIGFSHTQCLDAQPSEIAFPTLRTGGAGHAVAHEDVNGGMAMTLRSGGDGGVPSSRGENLVIETAVIAIQDGRAMEKNQNGMGVSEPGAPSYTLDQTGSQSVAYDEYNDALVEGGVHHSLRSGTKQSNGVIQNMVVRRLMPSECEALMGWPLDHTRWAHDGKEQSDTHRYKQCGNGVASPVAKWIAERYATVLTR